MAALRSNALTTLPNLKTILGLNEADTGDDDMLIQLINKASASVEKAIGRNLGNASYTERHKGSGTQDLLVENYPINSVEYIKLDGIELDPEEYDALSESAFGNIYRDCGWSVSGYPQGLAGDVVTTGKNIEIKYSAGFILPKDNTEEEPTNLPADLEGLVHDMIEFAYGKKKTGGNAGLKSFSISDVRWEWNTETPSEWQDIINSYKRIVVL